MQLQCGRLRIHVFDDAPSLAIAAAEHASAAIRDARLVRDRVRVVAASAASQIAFLRALSDDHKIPWNEVELFQLDEYCGLPTTHPASFSRFLNENLVNKAGIVNYYFLDGSQPAGRMWERARLALVERPPDVLFCGIGENAHLAFNDPPADFETRVPYAVVSLDETCREQQVAEGWFRHIDEVPTIAVTMTVHQMLQARQIIAVVPGPRKARAVQLCLTGSIRREAPGSALRLHPNATLYLDRHSASMLTVDPLSGATP